jgi:hypothetical protein
MKNTIKITAILLFTSIFSSCVFNHSKSGSENVTTEKRKINPEITEINVSNAINVELRQGNKANLEVTADSNLLEDIETYENGNIIYVKLKNNINLNKYNDLKVSITLPNIYHIKTMGASSLNSNNTFITKELTIESSSSSNINVSVETENLTVDCDSASEIILSGKAINAKFDSSSSSSINAFDLLVNNVIAEASSASDIKCNPIVNLDAKASSAGSVVFLNKPKFIKKEESSAGTVRQN